MPAAPAAPPVLDPPRFPADLRMTRAEFDAASETTETRVEWLGVTGETRGGEPLGAVRPVHGFFDDGTPAVATEAHDTILTNLFLELGRDLDRGVWKLSSQDLELRTPSGRGRFTDVMLTPEPAVRVPHPQNRRLALTNAAVVFEILSDSTEAVDLGEKRADYLSAPSVTDYVIFDQDEPLALHHTRADPPAAAEWRVRRVEGLAATVTLAAPAVALPLAAVYARVFDAAAGDPA